MNFKDMAITMCRCDAAMVRAGIDEQTRGKVLTDIGRQLVDAELKSDMEETTMLLKPFMRPAGGK